MKKFILGIVGIASVFLATSVFAVGTATVKIDINCGYYAYAGNCKSGESAGNDRQCRTKFDSGH